MKPILTLIFFAFLFSFLPPFFTVSADDIIIKVNGMTCSLCSHNMQKKLSALPETDKVIFDLDEKFISIKTKKDKTISDEQINKIITDGGFNVDKIERK